MSYLNIFYLKIHIFYRNYKFILTFFSKKTKQNCEINDFIKKRKIPVGFKKSLFFIENLIEKFIIAYISSLTFVLLESLYIKSKKNDKIKKRMD